MSENKGIWYWDTVKWITGLSILLYIGIFALLGFTEEANRAAIQWSARISFSTFCLAFGANAIHQFFKNSLTFWLLMNRKYLGISFAISHFLHLVWLGMLQYSFHPVFTLAKKSAILAGSIAYLFLFGMFLTSFDTFASKLSKRKWKWLHTIGGYWIGGVFLSTYYKRAVTEPLHWAMVGILLILLLLRIKENLSKRTLSSL